MSKKRAPRVISVSNPRIHALFYHSCIEQNFRHIELSLDSSHLGLHVHIIIISTKDHAYGPCSVGPFTTVRGRVVLLLASATLGKGPSPPPVDVFRLAYVLFRVNHCAAALSFSSVSYCILSRHFKL